MKLIKYKSIVEGVPHKSDRKTTEELLLKEIRSIKNRFENSKLSAYHAIGTKINGFYGKSYGNNEMARIAKTLDLPVSTVYKMVQFAEKYDHGDVEEISEGSFQFSWHRLRDNLSLPKDDVLRVYRASHTIAEFSKKILQLKRRLKSKEDREDHNGEGSKGGDEFYPDGTKSQLQTSDSDPSEAVPNLQAEITKLQSELDQKNRQLEVLYKMLEHWKTDWIKGFPEILRNLDKDTLQKLEHSFAEEKSRRETKNLTTATG